MPSSSPPFLKLANFVMSNLPLGFLAPWQPEKQFSFKRGATSLMKLTGPLGAAGGGSAAVAACGARKNSAKARAAPSVTHRMQKQNRDRSFKITPG